MSLPHSESFWGRFSHITRGRKNRMRIAGKRIQWNNLQYTNGKVKEFDETIEASQCFSGIFRVYHFYRLRYLQSNAYKKSESASFSFDALSLFIYIVISCLLQWSYCRIGQELVNATAYTQQDYSHQADEQCGTYHRGALECGQRVIIGHNVHSLNNEQIIEQRNDSVYQR